MYADRGELVGVFCWRRYSSRLSASSIGGVRGPEALKCRCREPVGDILLSLFLLLVDPASPRRGEGGVTRRSEL